MGNIAGPKEFLFLGILIAVIFFGVFKFFNWLFF
nr:hypothetical protein K4PH164_LOCUS25 [Klebsiella phage vB_Ko_K4PH164]